MHESELLSPYATKALEYGLAILYLALFVPFWRYLNAPAAPAPRPRPGGSRTGSTSRRRPSARGARVGTAETGGVTVGLDDFGHDLVGPLEGSSCRASAGA